MCDSAATPTESYVPRRLSDEQTEQLDMLLKLLASSDVDDAIERYYLNHGEGEAPKTPINQKMYDEMARHVEDRYSFDYCCEVGNIWNEAFEHVCDGVYERLDALRQSELDVESFTVPEVSKDEREAYARVRKAKIYECIDRCCNEQGFKKPSQLEADRIADDLREGDYNEKELMARIAEALKKLEAA